MRKSAHRRRPVAALFELDPLDRDVALRIGWAFEPATGWHQRRPDGFN